MKTNRSSSSWNLNNCRTKQGNCLFVAYSEHGGLALTNCAELQGGHCGNGGTCNCPDNRKILGGRCVSPSGTFGQMMLQCAEHWDKALSPYKPAGFNCKTWPTAYNQKPCYTEIDTYTDREKQEWVTRNRAMWFVEPCYTETMCILHEWGKIDNNGNQAGNGGAISKQCCSAHWWCFTCSSNWVSTDGNCPYYGWMNSDQHVC
jgi:hypothetical protein